MVTSIQTDHCVQFGEWTVIGTVEPVTYRGKRHHRVRAQCSCGRLQIVLLGNLRTGKSTKCVGCGRKKHGHSKTAEYRAWSSMIRRCNKPGSSSYPHYGARGVTICARWDPTKGGSYENFYADVGPKPSPEHQLDKEAVNPNNLTYGPETTKWVTRTTNQRHKRNTRRLTWKGESRSVSEWAEITGLTANTIYLRLKAGWSTERALSAPARQRIPAAQHPLSNPVVTARV